VGELAEDHLAAKTAVPAARPQAGRRLSSPAVQDGTGHALALAGVGVWIAQDGRRRHLVRDVDWTVRAGEHWILLGANGAGKTTLLAVAGGRRQPSEGHASVLGRALGHTDVRDLWSHVGAVDATIASQFARRLSCFDVVLTGATGTIAPRWGRYGTVERARARELMAQLGCTRLAGQAFSTCSLGERQRVLIARALMPDPSLLLLDEPATGLDLPSREALLAALDGLAAGFPALASVTVTHHVEDVPSCATHALLLRDGEVVAAGPVAAALTGATLSDAFGLPVTLSVHGGRYAARATPA
jgi:iron complex transport system ATP-binding protein